MNCCGEPILDDWANEIGVKIEWCHFWRHQRSNRFTAFGYDKSGLPHHNTLVLPDADALQLYQNGDLK